MECGKRCSESKHRCWRAVEEEPQPSQGVGVGWVRTDFPEDRKMK